MAEDSQAFDDFLARQLAKGGTSAHAADLHVAFAAAHGDPSAIAEVARRLRTLEPTLAGLGAPPELRHEILEDLLAGLVVPGPERASELLTYSGRGPLGGWLAVMAIREARRRLVRARRRHEREKEAAAPRRSSAARAPSGYGPDRRATRAILTEALDSLSPSDRDLLRRHFVDGMTMIELGALHGVHAATVCRWLEKARARLLGAIHDVGRRRLDLGPPEAASLVRLVRSTVDLSLGHAVGG